MDGILLALDHPSHPYDVYHIGSGESWSTAEVVAILRELIPEADLSVGPAPPWFTDEVVGPKKGPRDIPRARSVLGYQPKEDLCRGCWRTLPGTDERNRP